jgi:pyruvate dehydrogenase E1 component alpha subunit
MSDPAKYRTKNEVEEYKQRDPIEVVKRTILSKKFATEQELESIDQKIIATVEESVRFAEESEYPDPSEAFQDVYVQSDYPFVID